MYLIYRRVAHMGTTSNWFTLDASMTCNQCAFTLYVEWSFVEVQLDGYFTGSLSEAQLQRAFSYLAKMLCMFNSHRACLWESTFFKNHKI